MPSSRSPRPVTCGRGAFSIGEFAVKLARQRDAALVDERKSKEEPTPALDMLNDPRHADEGDVVTMPATLRARRPQARAHPCSGRPTTLHRGEVMSTWTPPDPRCPRAQGRTQDARCRADQRRRSRPSDGRQPDATPRTRRSTRHELQSSKAGAPVGEDLARGRWRRPDRQAPGRPGRQVPQGPGNPKADGRRAKEAVRAASDGQPRPPAPPPRVTSRPTLRPPPRRPRPRRLHRLRGSSARSANSATSSRRPRRARRPSGSRCIRRSPRIPHCRSAWPLRDDFVDKLYADDVAGKSKAIGEVQEPRPAGPRGRRRGERQGPRASG